MENVTDEISNPFGMRPPCPHRCGTEDDRRAVYGYGDANADFHVIGNHPGVHGGATTGIPFTDHASGTRILKVLAATGFLDDETDPASITNAFLSYRYLCCVPPNTVPRDQEYAAFEPFFDAELRAIAADVLLPVGHRATEHILTEYTAKADRLADGMDVLHGHELKGRGFLVLPMKAPSTWNESDETAIIDAITELKARDYQQLVDLGRFIAGGDPYFVR